jgi:hypothetical protein
MKYPVNMSVKKFQIFEAESEIHRKIAEQYPARFQRVSGHRACENGRSGVWLQRPVFAGIHEAELRSMSAKTNFLIRISGRFTLFMAAVFLLLFLANLRSRRYYHGPDYSFLFWMFFYCLLTGIGLLKLRKWAVLFLFLPGILSIAIFVYGWTKDASAPMPWALLNYGFLATLVAVPILILRSWHELRW